MNGDCMYQNNLIFVLNKVQNFAARGLKFTNYFYQLYIIIERSTVNRIIITSLISYYTFSVKHAEEMDKELNKTIELC